MWEILGSPSKFECGKTCGFNAILVESKWHIQDITIWVVMAIKNSKIYIDTICVCVRVAKFFGYAMYTCV
jgi:hypothetical protein